ncbi:MAG: hypothetical protein KAU46_02665 [Candidatus Aminicenantes bacterium]|nr:hypothetical protein [Candidatus Aminicenantes bacterium]
MLEELKAHKFLLESMLEIESIESIKGVARIYNSKIGNENTDRIYLFIPDLHIVSRKLREKRFEYGFNHERVFVDLLRKLRDLQLGDEKYAISVCQLGDFVDLWRENVNDPVDILSDFQGVRDYSDAVDARYLLGNHDVDIAKIPRMSPRWHFRLFFPDDNQPKVYVTHGDVFDWIEKLPDRLQKWAVHHFSPREMQPQKRLKKMIKYKKKKSLMMDPSSTLQTETLAVVPPDGELDDIHLSTSHKFLVKAFERTKKMNSEFDLSITAAVVAHTHVPAIAYLEDADNFFVLMDCGSWQGKYQEPGSEPKANCQVGIVCGNEFRVYQLDPNLDISPQLEPNTIL